MTKINHIGQRRAEVAKLRVQRLSIRQIAEQLSISSSAVKRDLDALAEEWAKSRGDFEEQLNQTLMDVDAVQAASAELMDSLTGTERLQAADRMLKSIELRARLLNQFPKPGNDTGALPTGPIELHLSLVSAGNSDLIRPPAITADLIALEGGEDE